MGEHVDEEVHLAGWLHRLRRLSDIAFLLVRDGKGIAQIVVHDAGLIEQLGQLENETVLSVRGTVRAVAQAPGGVEVHDPSIEVISASNAAPPIDLYRPTLKALLPTILDHAPVTLRHPRSRAFFRLASASSSGFRETLRKLDFTEVHTPKIVAAATEGGANVFAIDYFGTPAYLAQSPQFYKQILVGVFERVFEVGPVFRAEPHDTPRHLNEYTSLDAEMAFIQDHTTVMLVLAEVIRGMLATVLAECPLELALLKVELPELPTDFPSIHFAEAQAMISRATGEDLAGEPDLSPSHERWLGDWARREHNSDFLFVTGYPMVKRPFYTHPDADRPAFSNSFDLLFRGLELVTGGQRLHRYEEYLAALAARDMPAEPFVSYLEPFRHGMPPHGGFAIGLERWVARLACVPNVRETALFPRDLRRLSP